MQERVRNSNGKAQYKYDENGDIVLSKEKKGVPMSDVWEIPFLNSKAKERMGYPTQKPIELLERIIRISIDEGDIVLDPFCGSGTTLVASKLLNRKYIGIDKNIYAVKLCNERLKIPIKITSRLMRLGANVYKTKTEKELALLNILDCDVVQRNKGIDGILKKYYLDAPVAVKIQKSNESFSEAANLLVNAARRKKCSFMVLIRTSQEVVSDKKSIQPNMIVIDSCKLQLDLKLSEMLNSDGKKTLQG